MSPSDTVLFAVIAVMAINHFTLRLPGWEKRLWLFWVTQICNLLMACYLIWYGIPDFQGSLWVVNLMIALLFMFHIIVNNRRLTSTQIKKDDRPRLSEIIKQNESDSDENPN